MECKKQYVIAYDFGTTGVKTCLFEIGEDIRLLQSSYAGYDLFVLENGGAEQDTEQWWSAMCETTQELMKKSSVTPMQISGISFCSQMQGLVLVDRDGNALRRPMSYMDQRAGAQMKRVEGHGLQISGVNIGMLFTSLHLTRAASTSVKDPLWKYKWVEEQEPEIFAKVYKWLDVKEYLICRCTGAFVMTRDSAYATFLYDSREGHNCWSDALCRMYGVNKAHLPELIDCTQMAGKLTAKAATELGLAEGTPVFGGGGDATLIGIGAGCTEIGDTHIYSGTSGWVTTIIPKQKVDIINMIAGIVGAEQGKYNYFAEMETAGKCFEWVKDHLALDEIDIYLEKKSVSESEACIFTSLYDYLTDTVSKIPPGAGGVLFTPWLHGNRCPFEDPNAAGMFFNIRIETGKTEMIRAVLEGICYHLRWMLETQDQKIKTAKTLRFVGGGALSSFTCQILADITGRTIETVEDTQDVGAVGAALLVAVGTGTFPSLARAKQIIRVEKRYVPNQVNRAVYEKNYAVFRRLHKCNEKNFALLNGQANRG